ncbi:SDR family oxidoreductase [Pseudohoeflea coraliihabitans]|uniref:SDR family oxidoreductase n=1 Tax=Pseudohoeflea coraliihabitans TaxID=2860393 RepID=A0ABS6WSX7_9HYPH|nr:SDR family oxidoreductase [Pseudohoeflea sp. DP4N28-3]MBW3099066.1 SDR family oxidoreductase [Pseudohoeflea sp. DP4N28-3]
MRLLVLGAGFSGKAILRELMPSVKAAAGTSRGDGGQAEIAATGATPLLYEGQGIGAELADVMRSATHLVVSIAPDATNSDGAYGGDPVLADLAGGLVERLPALEWVGYLSTVGVYGDQGGAWVDETVPCRPLSKRSLARLAAEQAWQRTCLGAGLPLAILRLAGIYGPGRNALNNLAAGTARRIVKPGQVFNRIHVDDIAGAVAHLATRGQAGIYNIADDRPAPPQDVVAYAARLMSVDAPPEIAFDDAPLSPMGRSFYGENKRVSNARIKAAGYQFLHPDYGTGLDALWKSGAWRS